jgi:small subunit ribosomal protein S1
VEGVVRSVLDFGMFVDLGEVEALVRKDDYLGTYHEGDRFRGEIIELKGNRIKLKELY